MSKDDVVIAEKKRLFLIVRRKISGLKTVVCLSIARGNVVTIKNIIVRCVLKFVSNYFLMCMILNVDVPSFVRSVLNGCTCYAFTL